MLLPYSFLAIYGFLWRRDYLLAVLLVGQPILKLMLKPFPGGSEQHIFLIIYFIIGFYLWGLIRLYNRGSFLYGQTSLKIMLFYFIFLVLLVFSLLYTLNRPYGTEKIAEFFFNTFPILLITLIFLDSEDSVQKTMNAIGNLSLLIGIVTVLVTLNHTGSLFVRVSTSDAKNITFLGVNLAVSIWFGRRMGIAFLAMLCLTLFKPINVNKLKTFMLLILTLLSVSRGPVFSLLATIVIMLIIIFRCIAIRKVYRKVLMIVLFGFSLVGFLGLYSGSLERMFFFGDSNILSRLNMYSLCIRLIKENLLGYGIGAYSVLGTELYPHNIFLEILVEIGIVGLISLLIPLAITIKENIKLIWNNDKQKWVLPLFSLSVIFFAILNALFSGDITSNEYVWFSIVLSARVKELVN